MRTAIMLSVLMIAQVGWGVCANAQTPTAWTARPLIVIPTAFQELNELRVNTGEKTLRRDGTVKPMYVKTLPAEGSSYLNFHVDIASDAGNLVLHSKDIHLDGAPAAAATLSYTPFNWFIDTGTTEMRGDSLLIVNDKAIVQFTIEVPTAGFDDLALFVRSQRIGTVREIRERIVRDRGTD